MFAWAKNIFGICLIAVICAPLAAVDISSAAERIRVAKGGYSAATPPYFTYAAPFLLKQDIVVEDILMSSGTLAGQALSSGDVKLLLTTGAIAMQADMAGGDLVIIAGAVHKLPYQIVARPEIKSTADLKGKRVGISRFGSSSEWIIRLGFAKLGLDADRDFAMIQIGGPGDRFTALQSNRALLKRFLMGLATALYNYQDDPPSGIAFQAKLFKFTPEQAEIAYRASARGMHADLRLPDAQVLDSAMKEIAARVEKARGMNPAELKVVDGSLRQELVNEGFFERFNKKAR